MIAICLTILAVVLLLVLGVYERTTALYKAVVELQGPGVRLPIIGNSYVLLSYTAKSGFTKFRNLANKFRHGYCYYYLGTLFINIQSAEAFEKMLTSTNTKKGFFYQFLVPYIGHGILTSHGPKWFERRRLIIPSFHFSILNRFFHIFRAHTDTMIASLNNRQSHRINVKPLMSKYSLGLICETSMGVKVQDTSEYENSLKVFGHWTQSRVFSPHLHSDKMYRLLGYAEIVNRVIKPMHEFTKDLIAKRRAILASRLRQTDSQHGSDEEGQNRYFNKNQSSLLDALLIAQTKNGSINDDGIEEEVNTFVFTGHDTITSGLTYTLLCIAEHPEVQQKVFEEIQAIVSDDELTINHLQSCSYLDMVVKESLRLLPPVPLIVQTLEQELEINGVTLPRGTNFQMLIFDLHRDPKWFPEPEKFIPERFLPENVADRHHFAYVPFSAGLRNCIGQKYAIMQLKTMIIKVIQRYRLEAVTKIKDLVFIMDMILHTENPVEIQFIRRSE